VWRNAPNISYEDITGYEIKLINLATNKEVNISLDASATYYDLDELENETLKHESTMIQVFVWLNHYNTSYKLVFVAYRFVWSQVSILDC
jgi:hypothetical protein